MFASEMEWFLYNQKLTFFDRLAIQFSETDPFEAPPWLDAGREGLLSGLDGLRRGSVLIRGASRCVNVDRRFFRDLLEPLRNLLILQVLQGAEMARSHAGPAPPTPLRFAG
jgi:hypothetical protein